MRILADENVPVVAVATLRKHGHDVTSIYECSSGATDKEVVRIASRDGRVIVTFDKDFGDMALRAALSPRSGVILLRLPLPDPGKAGNLIAAIVESRADWAGHFSVVDKHGIRMRPLHV